MARRKRKEEVPVWEPPEFDEVGYMRKEIENAKISLVVIAWAVVGAILAYLFYAFDLAPIGFLLGLLVFGALYFVLPMLGLPIHGFKRRDWASHAMVYFFSFLAFSIILLNAPFGDHTYPEIGSFQAGTFDPGGSLTVPAPGSMYCYAGTPGSTVTVPGSGNQTVYLIFRATDNAAVRDLQVRLANANLTATPVANEPDACVGSSLTVYMPDTYAVAFSNTGSPFHVTITATDSAGLSTTASLDIVTA